MLDPSAVADSRISGRIFVRGKSTEKFRLPEIAAKNVQPNINRKMTNVTTISDNLIIRLIKLCNADVV